MSISSQALEIEAIYFQGVCRKRVYDNNFSVVAIAYSELNQDDFDLFTKEFIKTLKYPNLKIGKYELPDLNRNRLKLTCLDIDQAINDLKTILNEYSEVVLNSIFLDPSDRIILNLFVNE